MAAGVLVCRRRSRVAFEFWVDRIEPMHRISFRWHPSAVDSGVDYSSEPTTLIVFELEEVPGGTRATISESGFDYGRVDKVASIRLRPASTVAPLMLLC